MVATTTAYVGVVAATSAFVVTAVSSVALSDGYSVDSLAEGGERLQYFCSARSLAVPISVSARACSLSFCCVAAVTAVVIASFRVDSINVGSK